MSGILDDLRYALRGLRKTPGFTTVAVLTLTLGIGANTAMFTLVDQVLLRLLPVQNAHELVLVTHLGARYGGFWGDGSELSYPMYADFRDHNQAFAGMFARFNSQVHARIDNRTDRVSAEFVTDTYFTVLRVGGAQGRTILPGDDAAGADHPVVVISHRCWINRFGGDPAVVGKTITVNNHPLSIIGVGQTGFDGTNIGIATELFLPIRMIGMSPEGPGDGPVFDDRRAQFLNVFARLRPGVSREQAQASLQPFYASRLALEVQEPAFARATEATKAEFLQNTIDIRPAGYGKSALRDNLSRPLAILMAIVAAVLLIACANLANLLLARASARQREFAIRLSLGATPQRLAQQLFAESMLLALAGSAGAVFVATWGADALLRFLPNRSFALTVTVSPDDRILAFNLLAAVFTALAFGFVPALRSTRPALAPTLKDESGTVVGGGHARLRRAFVISQVTLSVLLLVGAGLFVRSLRNVMHTDLGFETSRVLVFQIEHAAAGYDGVRGKAFAKRLRERLESTPGVVGATFSSHSLLTGGAWRNAITIDGRPYNPAERVTAANKFVSPGYFATLGIPLIDGRDFDGRDEQTLPPGSPPLSMRTAIANQAFVKRYLLDGKPAVGRRIGLGRNPGTPTPIEIVGVVGDAKYTLVREEIPPQLYFPFLEASGIPGMVVYVRTRTDPAQLAGAVRDVVRELDPMLPVEDMRTMAEQVDLSVANDRLMANLSTVFGLLATLLAMIGLYGVMAYSVTRRTREIGVRMALGAVPGTITRLVMHEVGVLMLVGVVCALPLMWGLTRFVEGVLYGVTPMDPLTIGFAISFLALVAGLAGFLPAYRASRINPLVALRYE
jgi:predicted permease